MRCRLALALAVALFGVTPALAQILPPQAPPPQGPLDAQKMRNDREEYERERKRRESPERVERANRVSALLNAGDCKGAYELAMNEKDAEMAKRVREVCTADKPKTDH